MSPDDLYQQAVQAGILPGGFTSDQDPSGVGYSNPGPPPALADQFPHDMTASDNPNGPTTMPEGAPPAMPGSRTSTSTATSGSVSSKGYDPRKMTQLNKNDAALQSQDARDEAAIREQRAPDEAILAQANTDKELAAHHVALATIAKIGEEGHQAQLQQDLQGSFAADEAKLNAKADADSAVAKGNYEAALADFRASRVDPSQLWGNMSGGMQFGTLASVFVHDFLGVKGMKTSAMDTLNTAIDRNINAQLQAIKTKGEVANGFKDLWYMQRSQAASDAEARTRVRGFMLESAKQGVIAALAPFESGLASAQGQTALATIEGEAAKNTIDLHYQIDQQISAQKAQNQQLLIAKMNNAVTSFGIASANKRAENELKQQLALAKGSAPTPGNDYLINPETHRGEWVKKGGVSDTEWAKVKGTVIQTAPFNAAVQKLRDFAATLPPVFDPIRGTRLSEEQQREYDAIATVLAHNMVHGNGERATDQDIIDFRKMLPQATSLTNGGVEKILAYAQQQGFITPQAYIEQYADDVPYNSQPLGARGQIYAGAKADATAVESGEADKITHGQLSNKNDLGNVYGPGAMETATDPGAYSKEAHDAFFKVHPELMDEYMAQRGIKDYKKLSTDYSEDVTKVEDGLTHLAMTAKRVGPDDKPTVDAISAKKALEFQADAYRNAKLGSATDWRSAYAAWLLTSLDNETK